MRLAVIPARGGSKRIPRKNIKPFFNRPMMSWSIDAARQSGCFDRILVSTDDEEIAHLARELGAETPFMRPKELANDFAGATAVVAHATQWAIDQGFELQAVCCILATAPFIRVADIEAGWRVFLNGQWDFVFAATDFASPIFRAFRTHEQGGVEMYFPDYFDSRSQDLPAALHDAAQFYWGRPVAWLEGRRVFATHSSTILIPRWRVQDIDTPEDWRRAEILAPLIMTSS